MPRGAHGKVTQLLEKHACHVTEEDLPGIDKAGLGGYHNSEIGPVINAGGSSLNDSVADDLSALTPIPEYHVLMTNRWETGASPSKRKDAASSNPPRPPQRPQRSDDATECTEQSDTDP
jgi:hypothetical protein